MVVCAISDMHGQYDFSVQECDILCICGDIVPLEIQRPPSLLKFDKKGLSAEEKDYYVAIEEQQKNYYEEWRAKNINWLEDVFIPWCDNQPCKKVFLVGGNHDFIFEEEGKEGSEKLFDGTKITYLQDESAEYEGLKIYGTPWCHKFGNWAFMRNYYSLGDKFRHIPENVDILLTHDAPYGRDDMLLESERFMSKGHIGNKSLTKRLERLKNPPRFHFTGHLHSCNHVPVDYDGTITVCVSMLDEGYYRAYEPFRISF